MFWYLQYGTTTSDLMQFAIPFVSRPSYRDLDWLMPSIQVLQSDHESQVQPPAPPPQPEEQDHTPELQPQTQGANQEPNQPSQPQTIHEARSLPLSIGLGE